MRYLIFTLALFCTIAIKAQEDDYVNEAVLTYEDRIYQNNIAAVRFHIMGADLSYPIIDITDGRLLLTFDDLDGDAKNYYYTIVHCDRNWKPTEDLTDMDYIDGFTEEEIDNFEYSENTLQQYVNYKLMLPNEDMRWKISGNYLLIVYGDEGREQPYITRRFVVVEPKVRILAEVTRAFDAGKMETHQEVDFIIDHKGFKIPNPKQEITAVVMQNGDWNRTVDKIEPLFIKPDRLEFDYQGKVMFPALREFRYLDLRSFRYRTDKVKNIYETQNLFEVELIGERVRAQTPYLFERDMNGNFIVQNVHEDDHDIESDYAMVTFYLSKKFPYENGSVYVVGKMTDNVPWEEFRMTYNERIKAYETTGLLKQGFYNYLFAYVPDGTKDMNFEDLEGSDHEAENDYTVLVYFQSFSDRYDRVIGVVTVNSIGE